MKNSTCIICQNGGDCKCLCAWIIDKCFRKEYNKANHKKEVFPVKKLCTILAALTLVVLCVVMMPAEAEAAESAQTRP